MRHRKITKVIIAAAGYGTRFLPATKNQPKEMLPIIDKPIIQYSVEEAVKSGITDIILVTRAGQHIMEDYFDNNLELEYSLQESGKIKALEVVREIPQMANFVYVRQKKHLPYKNATPLLAAKDLVDDDEGFVYMFGDDLTFSDKPVTAQLIEVFEREKATAVIGVQEVPDRDVERYGTVEYKKGASNKYEVKSMQEKLPAGRAPSNMAQFGRFVFSYDVMHAVMQTKIGKDNELWLADVLNELVKRGKKVIAQPISGKWLTTGDLLNYLKATMTFALRRDDIQKELRSFLREQL